MLEQGEILRDRYKIIRRLGQGGMGAVYEAHDNVFDTSVALKEVTIDLSNALDTEAQEMTKIAFEREAKILAKISHETIPHVKDYFIEEDAQFLIMELVDGDDLAKLLKQRNAPFPVQTIMEWTDQLLDALDYLHNQEPPIIHRDIKPQNLKLTSRKKIKLLDFGIAKGTESKSANTVTNQTFIAATLNYSPIEQMVRVLDPTFLAVITHKYSDQIEGILEQNADFRTDIFALGATLYHLVTNTQPAEAVKRGIEVWDGKPDPLENPRKLNPEIPEEFSDFLLKSMQINRNHRFKTAAEMRSALEQISEVATKPSLTPTVEMNLADLPLQDTQADFTPPSTASDIPIPTPTNPTENPDTSSEIVTEVSKQKTPTPTPPAFTQQNQQQQNHQSQQQNFSSAVQTSPPIHQEQKKKSNKLLWLIPVAGLILVMFVGGALGVWLIVRNMGSGSVADTNTNTETNNANTSTDKGNTDPNIGITTTDTPEDTPEGPDITLDTNTAKDDVNTEPSPESTTVTKTTKTSSKPPKKTDRKPTKTTTKRPVKKPPTKRPPTKRPPKKPPTKPKPNDCIFTDTCE